MFILRNDSNFPSNRVVCGSLLARPRNTYSAFNTLHVFQKGEEELDKPELPYRQTCTNERTYILLQKGQRRVHRSLRIKNVKNELLTLSQTVKNL